VPEVLLHRQQRREERGIAARRRVHGCAQFLHASIGTDDAQVDGGVAQGVEQALMESVVYDDSGQLVTGSFQDYCMPRADDLPEIVSELAEIPSTTNPLGVKAAGEAGATGAPPAVIGAVLDALRPLGVAHIDMPATPSRVWAAIRRAKAHGS
jgi:carbon-monoxide dehydrogenase large subunit